MNGEVSTNSKLKGFVQFNPGKQRKERVMQQAIEIIAV